MKKLGVVLNVLMFKTKKMKANELRIGNNLRQGIVKSIYIDEGVYILMNDNKTRMLDTDELRPIKLTKEWMMKLGFEENRPWTFDKGKKGEWTTTLDGFSTEKGSEGFRLEWCEGKLCFELYYHYEEIKTVHRLQNLYFALTETELEIK